jgi:hypothetical protein
MTISSIAGIIAQILVSTSHLYFSLPYMYVHESGRNKTSAPVQDRDDDRLVTGGPEL